MSHIEDSVSINITESHLIAREEEYQYRIDLLRKIGRAAKATDES